MDLNNNESMGNEKNDNMQESETSGVFLKAMLNEKMSVIMLMSLLFFLAMGKVIVGFEWLTSLLRIVALLAIVGQVILQIVFSKRLKVCRTEYIKALRKEKKTTIVLYYVADGLVYLMLILNSIIALS